MTADRQPVVFEGPRLEASDQVPAKQEQQLNIAISDEASSTIIHVRSQGTSNRMSDFGDMLDRLGVQVITARCETVQSTGSSDMVLTVVDRHDSQPLDDCLKQSVRQGLHSMLQESSEPSSTQGSCDRQQCGFAFCNEALGAPATAELVGKQQQQHRQKQAPQVADAAGTSVGLDSRADDSGSDCAQASRACSRQFSFSTGLQQLPPSDQLEQAHANRGAGAAQIGVAMRSSPRLPRESPVHSPSIIGFSLASTLEPADTPPSVTAAYKPALKIDIPCGSSLLSASLGPPRSTSHVQDNSSSSKQVSGSSESGSNKSVQQQQQHQHQHQQGFQAEDLTQRLRSLGLHQRGSAALVMEDSSSDDEPDPPVSRSSSRTKTSSDWQRWQGPVPWPGTSIAELPALLARHQQQQSGSSSMEQTPGRISATSSNITEAVAAEVAAAFADGGRTPCYRERTHNSDDTLPRIRAAAVAASAGNVMLELPAGDAEDHIQQVAASPMVGRPRRRPPARTPSRIILSPIAPDGTADPQGQPKLFVAIPKQLPDDKRVRRPPMRSATVIAAGTPSSVGRQNAIAALLGSQRSLGKLGPGSADPKEAAAAAAAANMPYNVAVAAAQLLGKDGNTREAAAAAAAAAAVAAGEQPGSPLSPVSASVGPAIHTGDLLSPVAATPRGLPPPPPTPVHPAVAAAAAAAIAAAAEAADEAAKEREALAGISGAIVEEGEGGSVDTSVGSEDSSSEEEWWCGSLTGYAVRDIMTAPLQVVSQDAEVAAARQLMVQHNLPGVLVDTGAGSEPGFITRRDLLKAQLTRRGFRRRHAKTLVRDIMSHPVIAFDASEPIELCAQFMQEKGVRRAAVRDKAAADPSNHLAEYVGLVSDASIFRCLGLYAEEGSALEEEDSGLTSVPALRRHSTFAADSSMDGSTLNSPRSGSRSATPLAQAQSLADPSSKKQTAAVPTATVGATCTGEHVLATLISHNAKQQQKQVLMLPDVAALREGLTGSVTPPAGSLGSDKSAPVPLAATAVEPHGAESHAGSLDEARASRPGSDSAASVSMNVAGANADTSSGGAVDALSRYKTAASLWEIDLSEVEPLKKIGEGSFGEVVLANYRGTKVAMKRLHAVDEDIGVAGSDHQRGSSSSSSSGSLASSHAATSQNGSLATFKQVFERECAILASIRHPNVVNFIGACRKPGQRCLVTEYCARGSLDQVLHKSGLQLDLPKRIEFAMDIARGMACLHAQKPTIVHRDLKTANLLVSARFEVKVADFGLSRIKDASHMQVSRAGLEGTIEYCAPEVLRGECFTEKADVYSFGVVLWELLLRKRPYADADVPIFLLMVNIGNGRLALPQIPVEAATPGLVDLAERCLSFAASGRPDFREILHLLEVEYRGLRAKQKQQPPKQQHFAEQEQHHEHQEHLAQQMEQQHLQQHLLHQQVPGGLRCDSALSLAMHQAACSAGEGADASNSSAMASPAGSGGAHGLAPGGAAAGSSSGYHGPQVTAGPDGMLLQDVYGFYQPQQYYQQPQAVQFHQPYVQPQQLQPQQLQPQRSRLSQADSLASSSGVPPSGGSAAHLMPAVPYMYADQHHMLSVPLPQLVIPQQQPQQQQQQQHGAGCAAGSTYNSPRGTHGHQPGPFQQNSAVLLPAFGAAAQQQLTPGAMSAAGSGGSGVVASSSKPPRSKQHLNRARSMPLPQSMNWDLQEEDEEAEEGDDPEGSAAGVQPAGMLCEDSFTSSEYGGGAPAIRCVSAFAAPSGQLCMVLDPATAAAPDYNNGMLAQPLAGYAAPGGAMYYAHPQQPVLLRHSGPVPVVLAQPGYVQYAPQQTTPPQQLQQQTQHQQQLRMQPRGLFSTPSPTPGTLATPPLSSSPSLNSLNPLAVMAAAGAAAAAARREGSSNSGAASPTAAAAAAAFLQGGAFAGLHRRSSSQGGGPRQAAPLHLLQGSDLGSPMAHSGSNRRDSETGHSTPTLVNVAPVAAPLLLQRLDSLNRSGSASPRSCGSLHCMLPAPALLQTEPGQVVGVVLAPGPPSCGGSPLSGPHLPIGHRHTGSSRLAIQGSYEMPLVAPGYATPARQGSCGSMCGECGHQLGSTPPGASFLHQSHQHLRPQVDRRTSLLRIDSNSRDRSISPFPYAADNGSTAAGAAGTAATYKSPFATEAEGSGFGAGLSPFAAASTGAVPSPFATAAAVSPFAAVASATVSNGGSRATTASPFAAAASGAPSAEDAKSSMYCSDVGNSVAAVAGAPTRCEAASKSGPGGHTSSRVTSPFAAGSSPFAAAANPFAAAATRSPFEAAAAADESASESDVVVEDDTSPRYGSRIDGPSSNRGSKGIGGKDAAAVSSKAALSPFALLQQNEEQ